MTSLGAHRVEAGLRGHCLCLSLLPSLSLVVVAVWAQDFCDAANHHAALVVHHDIHADVGAKVVLQVHNDVNIPSQ